MVNIVSIHGAWSSPVSFNYIQAKIKANWQNISYDHSNETIQNILNRSEKEINQPSVVIGHSLGGIVAMNLHDHPMVEKIITLASPLSGLELNLVQLYFSRSGLIKQITNDSTHIRQMKSKTYTKPVMHLIANRGFNPFIYEENDGVLPLKIQTGWTAGKVYEIDANHYEILQSSETINLIKSMIK